MTPEKSFEKWITTNLNGDWQKIETSSAEGIPDYHVCWNGVEFWAELKIQKGPFTHLRKHQFSWGQYRAKCHFGNVWVFSLDSDMVRGWQYPIDVEPSRKGHVKILSDPDIELTKKLFIHTIGPTQLSK